MTPKVEGSKPSAPANTINMAMVLDILREHDYFNHVKGSIVEMGFGLGKGAEALLELVSDGTMLAEDIWLYDSFAGFPEPSEIDLQSNRNPKKGDWNVHVGMAHELVFKYPSVRTKTKIIKGFVQDTLIDYDCIPEKIKILIIDLDLYVGYNAALIHAYDLVSPGGLIYFDEYDEVFEGRLKWPGAKMAIDDFLKSRGRHHDLVKTGSPKNKAYLIK